MRKYDEAVKDGRVLLTELSLHAINSTRTDSRLKMKKTLDSLRENLAVSAEAGGRRKFLGKIQDALIVTENRAQKEARLEKIWNDVHQLQYCRKCRCASCPFMDEQCQCNGCVYGAYVSACEGGDGLETRTVAPNTITCHGMGVEELNYDRLTGNTVATVKNKNGIQNRLALNLETGEAHNL